MRLVGPEDADLVRGTGPRPRGWNLECDCQPQNVIHVVLLRWEATIRLDGKETRSTRSALPN